MSATEAHVRPQLSGNEFEANEWVSDGNQRVDYELIVDGWQYLFAENDGLRFVAFGKVGNDKLSGHPDLFDHSLLATIPKEVLELFSQSRLVPLNNGVPISDSDPIEILGPVDAENDAQMLMIDDPQRPEQAWKNAESVVRELCTGLAQLDVNSSSPEIPSVSVDSNDQSLLVSFTSETDTDHIFRFDRTTDSERVWPVEMIQAGESYRMFQLPDFVENLVEAHGYTIEN